MYEVASLEGYEEIAYCDRISLLLLYCTLMGLYSTAKVICTITKKFMMIQYPLYWLPVTSVNNLHG